MTKTAPIRTVLFDLDGTLADTAPDLAYALNLLLQEQGKAPLDYARIRPEASHGAKALLQLGFGLAPGDAEYDTLRRRFLDLYAANICRHTRLFQGMRELLNDLPAYGMNWGIVTNKPAFLTEPLIEQLGLRHEAACIVSGDTTNNAKPHPEPLLHACKLAGSEAEDCLYIGDAERDILAGKQAGMHTLVALFGYIRDQEQPQDWGADGLMQQPGDIVRWLQQHNDGVRHD